MFTPKFLKIKKGGILIKITDEFLVIDTTELFFRLSLDKLERVLMEDGHLHLLYKNGITNLIELNANLSISDIARLSDMTLGTLSLLLDLDRSTLYKYKYSNHKIPDKRIQQINALMNTNLTLYRTKGKDIAIDTIITQKIKEKS